MPIDAWRAEARALQAASARLEPTPVERREWQVQVDAVINEFLDDIACHRTFSPDAAAALATFAAAVSKPGASLREQLGAVKDGIQNAGILTAGPGHMGFIPGGGLYLGAVADHLAAALNPFSADWFAAPVAVRIHNEAVRWLCGVVGYGEGAYGDITSGGSAATLAALHAARRALALKPADYAKTCVYVGEHTHHCAAKALDLLFGEDFCLRRVPSKQHAMDVAALSALIAADAAAGLRPAIVVATAGSTNLGKVDPLAAIADVAARYGMWLHVDAAYGGFFSLCPDAQALFAGLSRADAIVLDPHKGLFLPYGTGAVLVKDARHLRQSSSGAYLQDRETLASDTRSPMDYSLELSRPFRSLRLWLLLATGTEPALAAALQEKRTLARICAAALRTVAHIELVSEPELSIVGFRFSGAGAGADSDRETMALLQRLNAHPEAFLSSTVVDGRVVLRIAVLSFRTHLPTVERLIASIRDEAAALAQEWR